MSAENLIKQIFIEPFYKENRNYIGVELEFPLLNLSGGPVDISMLHGLLEYLLEIGFTVGETDTQGRGIFLINGDGDCLSFDNSYNNFEFALSKTKDLLAASHRFYKLYETIQSYLISRGHTLTGMGTNPFQEKAQSDPVAYPIYQTIRSFLSGFSGNGYHNYPDFPAWLSSVQTHLDVSANALPRSLSLFAALDFVRGLLFSNSLPLPTATGFDNTLCFRDYLWEESGFGSIKNITGPVNGTFHSLEDIMQMFLKKELFLQKKNNDYEIMKPVSIPEYIACRDEKENLAGYLSFKNVEITRRGTLEIRSDCAQPIASAFAPPAFNLGILWEMENAEKLLKNFFETHLPEELMPAPDRNTILRRAVIYGKEFPAPKQALTEFLTTLVSLAEKGLKNRGLKEEQLITPLYNRAENLLCPALATKNRLKKGDSLKTIIQDYANPDYRI